MTIEIGQVYKDAYPVNGRIRRFVVAWYGFNYGKSNKVRVAVLEPRKRKPSKYAWFKDTRFNGPHARGLVRVK